MDYSIWGLKRLRRHVDNPSVGIRRIRDRLRSAHPSDGGFTLIEVLTVMALIGIMAGIALTAFVSYQAQSQHRGAADELRSTLRMAGERALSEQRAYCVHIAAEKWDLFRGECGSGVLVETRGPQSGGHITMAPSFTTTGTPATCPSGTDDCVYFYPRGNSSDGSVVIFKEDRTDLRIDVEGLTARVSSDG